MEKYNFFSHKVLLVLDLLVIDRTTLIRTINGTWVKSRWDPEHPWQHFILTLQNASNVAQISSFDQQIKFWLLVFGMHIAVTMQFTLGGSRT